MHLSSKYVNRILTLVVILSVQGCVIVRDSRPPEEIVAERAATHLELLRQQEWEQALAYTTPGFRSQTTPEQYSGRYGGVWMWKATRVGDVSCDGEPVTDRCKVQTYRTVSSPHLTGEIEHYSPKVWINVDRQWFIYEK